MVARHLEGQRIANILVMTNNYLPVYCHAIFNKNTTERDGDVRDKFHFSIIEKERWSVLKRSEECKKLARGQEDAEGSETGEMGG